MSLVDLSCIIYADASVDELTEKLGEVISRDNDTGAFHVHDNEIEFVKNLDFNPANKKQFPDGFLYFEKRIEIFPDETKEVPLENQIEFVAMVLNTLWSQNIPAVATCDYEDSLPNKGGYKSNNIPWG